MYIYIYLYIYIYISLSLYIYIHIYIHTDICIYIYIHVYAHTRARIFTRMAVDTSKTICGGIPTFFSGAFCKKQPYVSWKHHGFLHFLSLRHESLRNPSHLSSPVRPAPGATVAPCAAAAQLSDWVGKLSHGAEVEVPKKRENMSAFYPLVNCPITMENH